MSGMTTGDWKPQAQAEAGVVREYRNDVAGQRRGGGQRWGGQREVQPQCQVAEGTKGFYFVAPRTVKDQTLACKAIVQKITDGTVMDPASDLPLIKCQCGATLGPHLMQKKTGYTYQCSGCGFTVASSAVKAFKALIASGFHFMQLQTCMHSQTLMNYFSIDKSQASARNNPMAVHCLRAYCSPAGLGGNKSNDRDHECIPTFLVSKDTLGQLSSGLFMNSAPPTKFICVSQSPTLELIPAWKYVSRSLSILFQPSGAGPIAKVGDGNVEWSSFEKAVLDLAKSPSTEMRAILQRNAKKAALAAVAPTTTDAKMEAVVVSDDDDDDEDGPPDAATAAAMDDE